MQIEFWQKALENLADAEDAFEKGRFNASANRAYYAAFQAAIAVLVNAGITTQRISHEWVQSTFNRELIYRKKVFPSEFKQILLKMQESRNIADYSEVNISQKESKRQLQNAKRFIELIKKEIEK
jgi:uncharacterized protein (UPF0332 family)